MPLPSLLISLRHSHLIISCAGEDEAVAVNKEFFFNLYLCIYFWLRWVFVVVRRLSLVAASGGLLFVAVRGLLIAVTSLVVEHGL